MSKKLDPMDLKQIISLHIDKYSNLKSHLFLVFFLSIYGSTFELYMNIGKQVH